MVTVSLCPTPIQWSRAWQSNRKPPDLGSLFILSQSHRAMIRADVVNIGSGPSSAPNPSGRLSPGLLGLGLPICEMKWVDQSFAPFQLRTLRFSGATPTPPWLGRLIWLSQLLLASSEAVASLGLAVLAGKLDSTWLRMGIKNHSPERARNVLPAFNTQTNLPEAPSPYHSVHGFWFRSQPGDGNQGGLCEGPSD